MRSARRARACASSSASAAASRRALSLKESDSRPRARRESCGANACRDHVQRLDEGHLEDGHGWTRRDETRMFGETKVFGGFGVAIWTDRAVERTNREPVFGLDDTHTH